MERPVYTLHGKTLPQRVQTFDGADHNRIMFRLSESLRRNIESMYVTYEEFKIRTTISSGIASCIPPHSKPNEILLTEADEALYKAKNKGRNQTQAKIIT